MRARNMFKPGGFAITSDFSSGYHCLFLEENDRTFLAFALHVTELTHDTIEWLEENHSHAYLHSKRAYIFKYAALPFGLSTSCKTFNDLITALVGSWRRLESDGKETRASSYIVSHPGACICAAPTNRKPPTIHR